MAKAKTVTVSGFSDETKIDRRTLKKYFSEAGLKIVSREGKAEHFDRGEALKAVEKLMAPASESGTSLREQKTFQEVRKLRIANDAKERLVILRSEVTSKARELGDKCTNLLYAKLVNELPASFSNDVTSNRVLAQNVVNQVVAEISSFGEIWSRMK